MATFLDNHLRLGNIGINTLQWPIPIPVEVYRMLPSSAQRGGAKNNMKRQSATFLLRHLIIVRHFAETVRVLGLSYDSAN
jgi:hypothetical protein